MSMFADPDLQARILREIRELLTKNKQSWRQIFGPLISLYICAWKRMLHLTSMLIELSICAVRRSRTSEDYDRAGACGLRATVAEHYARGFRLHCSPQMPGTRPVVT